MTPDYLAQSLLDELDGIDKQGMNVDRKQTATHDYVLIARLPPLSRLVEESQQAAIVSGQHAVIGMSMAEAFEDPLDDPIEVDGLAERRRSTSQSESQRPTTANRSRLPSFSKISSPPIQRKRPYESHDVYRAIEKKDLVTLFDIRDNAFALLVQKSGGQTPLLYASRTKYTHAPCSIPSLLTPCMDVPGIGKSHRDIPILITGALSRFVNNLPDDISEVDPKMMSLIRAVRANLKLAINESLSSNHTDLISSYLQIIIMSEGEKWIRDQTQNVALALRSGKDARPVKTARTAVTNFATRELRQLDKGNALASVEDYVANASCDLVLMGMWSIVTDKLGGSLLPTYQFSRDERIFKSFSDAIEGVSNKIDYTLKIPKHIRTAIEETTKIMDKRATNFPEKARLLSHLLDAPS